MPTYILIAETRYYPAGVADWELVTSDRVEVDAAFDARKPGIYGYLYVVQVDHNGYRILRCKRDNGNPLHNIPSGTWIEDVPPTDDDSRYWGV